jgi:hypothetical protein
MATYSPPPRSHKCRWAGDPGIAVGKTGIIGMGLSFPHLSKCEKRWGRPRVTATTIPCDSTPIASLSRGPGGAISGACVGEPRRDTEHGATSPRSRCSRNASPGACWLLRLGPRVSTDAFPRPCKGRDLRVGAQAWMSHQPHRQAIVEVPVNATTRRQCRPKLGFETPPPRRIPRVPPRPPGATPPTPATERGAIRGHAKIKSVAIAVGLHVVGSVAVMASASGSRQRPRPRRTWSGEPPVAPRSRRASPSRKPAPEREPDVTTCVVGRRDGSASCAIPASHRGDHAHPCDFTARAAPSASTRFR